MRTPTIFLTKLGISCNMFKKFWDPEPIDKGRFWKHVPYRQNQLGWECWCLATRSPRMMRYGTHSIMGCRSAAHSCWWTLVNQTLPQIELGSSPNGWKTRNNFTWKTLNTVCLDQKHVWFSLLVFLPCFCCWSLFLRKLLCPESFVISLHGNTLPNQHYDERLRRKSMCSPCVRLALCVEVFLLHVLKLGRRWLLSLSSVGLFHFLTLCRCPHR